MAGLSFFENVAQQITQGNIPKRAAKRLSCNVFR